MWLQRTNHCIIFQTHPFFFYQGFVRVLFCCLLLALVFLTLGSPRALRHACSYFFLPSLAAQQWSFYFPHLFVLCWIYSFGLGVFILQGNLMSRFWKPGFSIGWACLPAPAIKKLLVSSIFDKTNGSSRLSAINSDGYDKADGIGLLGKPIYAFTNTPHPFRVPVFPHQSLQIFGYLFSQFGSPFKGVKGFHTRGIFSIHYTETQHTHAHKHTSPSHKDVRIV